MLRCLTYAYEVKKLDINKTIGLCRRLYYHIVMSIFVECYLDNNFLEYFLKSSKYLSASVLFNCFDHFTR